MTFRVRMRGSSRGWTVPARRSARPRHVLRAGSARSVTHASVLSSHDGVVSDRALAALAAKQAGVVSTEQMRALGLPAGAVSYRVRTDRLFRVLRGVYSLSPHVDEWGVRWAAVLAAGEGAFLSHWSAAEVHGFGRARGLPEVTVPGVGGRSIAGLAVHRSRRPQAGDVVEVRGLRVASAPRTVLDLAAGADGVEDVRRLIREGEYVGALAQGAIREAIVCRPGKAGVAVVRRADPATRQTELRQTPIEDALRTALARTPLPPPRTQLWVAGASGRRYRADAGWEPFRLIVEADGRSAHDRSTSFEQDPSRSADLAAAGWLTLRFTRNQILDEPGVVAARTVATARTRGWSGR